MKTYIVPIKNMCDYPVGKARITLNNVGLYCIEPFKKTDAFLLYLPKLGRVHMYTAMFDLVNEHKENYRIRGNQHMRFLRDSKMINAECAA